jgi:hypothetical protein
VAQPRKSTQEGYPAQIDILLTTIAALGLRWYPFNMMRCQEQPRVSCLFCKNSYRCIHETFDQLQERRAAQTSRKRS